MSLEPFSCARSRSWCTSWKSRVASAVLTTNVGVTGSSHAGSWAPARACVVMRAATRAGSARRRPATISTRTGAPISTAVVGVSVEQLTDHPHALLQLHQRHHERHVAARAPAGGGARRSCTRRRARTPPGSRGCARGTPGTSAPAGAAAPRTRRTAGRAARRACPPRRTRCPGSQRAKRPPRSTLGSEARFCSAGLNFSIRNSIVATCSSPTRQMLRVVRTSPRPARSASARRRSPAAS